MNSYKEDILEIFQLDLPWNKLSGANILVTGATGLIGGCLVDALMTNPNINYNVYASGRNEKRALLRFEKYFKNRAFHFLKYDVMHPLDCVVCFDYIIHAASNASPNFFVNNPVEVIKSNIDGVSHLVSYGLSHEMKRFLYVSSGEIYGEGDGREFTEDYSGYVNCATMRACYPSSKRTAETLCVSYSAEYGCDVVIARPCHVYGPYFTESDNRVYAQFIRNVCDNEDIIMKSSGTQIRSWCYVVDCITALLYILLKGENCEAYNIANADSSCSIKEFAETVASITKQRVICTSPDVIEKTGYNPVSKSIFSTKKIQKLGWTPNYSLCEGLTHTIKELTEANR